MNERLLFAFYGDDFTGSTDAMEALTLNGLRTVLFLEAPSKETLLQFKRLDSIGIAGTARAKSPQKMKEELQPIFEQIENINPHYFHYKVCSTFDSSPNVGSIGYAADLARNYFTGVYHTLVGVPQLGRFTIFGNHFAKKEQEIYRLDRHPVMSKHPITPMTEANLKIHLNKQTSQSIGELNILDLEEKCEILYQKFKKLENKNIILYDALNDSHLDVFARYVTSNHSATTKLLIGSSGVEYALGKEWNKHKKKNPYTIKKTIPNDGKLLVVSGSASEITSEQTMKAKTDGFYLEKVPHTYFGKNEMPYDFIKKISGLLERKKKVILYTVNGPNDSSIEKMKEHFRNKHKEDIGRIIGEDLGKWTKEIIKQTNLKSLIISGGDTSGFVTKELNIYALEVTKSISPGAPLCVAYSKDEYINNINIALKGGQLGGVNYYSQVMNYS